jgi:hypothetical protein
MSNKIEKPIDLRKLRRNHAAVCPEQGAAQAFNKTLEKFPLVIYLNLALDGARIYETLTCDRQAF